MSDVDNLYIYGSTTQHLYEVFTKFKNNNGVLPEKAVRTSLNSTNLFPTHSQVNEYVHSACEADGRTPTDHITFGEFAYFHTEFQHYCQNHKRSTQPRSQMRNKMVKALQQRRRQRRFSVFLGGSCNPTTWRKDLAIPFFKKHNITYYNPQVGNWKPDLMELEDQAKQTAELLFFVIDNQTRSTASMVEAAYIAGCGRQLILVIRKFIPPVCIYDELICDGELEDLERSHAYLTDLVERMGIPVFKNLHSALKATKKAVYKKVLVSELGLQDGCQPVKFPEARIAAELVSAKDVFNNVDACNTGRLTPSDVIHAFKMLTRRTLTLETAQKSFTFEHFLCLLAEYKYQTSIWDYIVSFFFSIPLNIFYWLNWAGVWWNRQLTDDFRGKDVFLGGSCGVSEWRQQIAVPILRKHGVSYFNPQQQDWHTYCIGRENAIKHHCRVLLYVITEDTRAMTSMLEAGYYIGQGCNVVLCIKYVPYNASIKGHQLTQNAVNDYNRSRSYLADLANRDGIEVFEDITEAVSAVVQKVKA